MYFFKLISSLALLGIFALKPVNAGETTTLVEMLELAKGDAGVSMGLRPLKHDWVGDITDEEGEIVRMRLEKGRIMRGEIALLRTGPNGRYLGSDAPIYVKSIPTNEKLRSCSTLAELQKLLGAGEGGFSGWGGPKGMHSSHSWVCITTTAENRLTYLDAFAQTSFTKEQKEKGITQINEFTIRRGELRPADPDNPKERGIYLSGADMFAAEEAKKARDRLRFPEPLRTLILADEHPNDSDLKHLSAAIQAIRNDPNPKLFTQLVQEMHEGTLRIRSLLKHILLNERSLSNLKGWGAKEEAIAVGACIDSLPLAKDRAKDKLIEILLRVCGGGKIEIEAGTRGSRIEVNPTKNGYQVIYGGASDPLPLEEVQKELRRLYKKSRAK